MGHSDVPPGSSSSTDACGPDPRPCGLREAQQDDVAERMLEYLRERGGERDLENDDDRDAD